MNNFTLNKVLDHIRSDVEAVLSNVSDNDIRYMTPEDVCNLLDENSYFAPEVIYYADGWEVVAGSSFNDYDAEYLDFSNCTNSLACIMHEAQGKVDAAYYANREEIAADVLDGLQENLSESEDEIYSKSESRLNGLYWAETDNGNMLSFKTQDELYTFLNNQ